MPSIEHLQNKLEKIIWRKIATNPLLVPLNGPRLKDESIVDEGWPLPLGTESAEWRIAKPSVFLPDKYQKYTLLRLNTISEILLMGQLKDHLFWAEYEGNALKIESSVIPPSADPSGPYFIALEKGYRVSKARLTSELEDWNQHRAFEFGIECITRSINKKVDNGHHVSAANIRAINFLKISRDYLYRQNNEPLDAYFKELSLSKQERFAIGPFQAWFEEGQELSKLFTPAAKTDYVTRALDEMLQTLLVPIIGINRVLRELRVANAMFARRVLTDDGYPIPQFTTQDSNERVINEKIWFAYQKDELDNQVITFGKLFLQGMRPVH